MRKLDSDQYPLLVQLNWGKEDLEGRFLLHNEDTKQPPRINDGFYDDREAERTSKHDKKKKKPEKKQKNKKKDPHQEISAPQISEPMTAAQELYTQVPESTFTRTVSNPEAVMKKRREQKLQKKGAETLKIYGDRINPEHPYKSLLLLPGDKVPTVIQDTLNKYGLGKEKVEDYSIIKVVLPPNSKPEDSLQGGWGIETYLTDDECPLAISQDWQPHKGTLVFQLRHKSNVKKGQSKPSKQAPQNREKKRSETEPTDDPRPPDRKKHKTPPKKLPQEAMHPPKTKQPHAALVPMSPGPTEADMMGGDIIKSSDPVPKILEFSSLFDDYNVHVVSPSITEIGSDRNAATYGPFIEVENKTRVLPLHCVLANMDGVVTVTPHEGKNVEVFVDGHRIEETRMLNHSSVIWLGRKTHLVYCKPNGEIVVPYVVRQIKATNPNRKVLNDFTNQRRNAGQQQNYGKSKTLPLNAEPPQSDDNYIISKQQQGQHTQSTNDLYGQQPSQNHRPQQNGRGPVPGLNDRHQSISTHSHSLPCLLRINKELGEESFVSEIVNVNGTSLHFKLSPAYTIYLSLRDIVENAPKHLLDSSIDEYLCLVTDLLDQTIQMNKSTASELAFWMANSSELLNFIRQDQDLSHLTTHMQDVLAKIVQLSFRHLVQCMQIELYEYMSAFLSYSDDDIPGGEREGEHRRSAPGEDPNMYDILHMLSSAMSLLRRCRVNAALTIQLFSQLFHFINMWIFNEVACKPEQRLCCRVWGIKIRTRLARVEAWAEKQGLELAADCHLARVTQAMHLLQAPKQSADDIAAISGTCFKLNSLQLRALLSNYEPSYEDGETEIANELIDNVVSVAENTADELIRSDGREICLEEDPDLQLPFLLPEDGYSCDVVRSIPSGLREFLKNLQREELCTYTVIADAPGSWTVHFAVNSARESAGSDVSAPASHVSSHTGQPEIATVVLNKRGGGMGLSIVAAKGMGQEKSGIYIRSVVKGGAAYHDRRLQAGDQLLSVDGHSLVGVSQERAADLMTKTGQRVTLTVAKQGAVFHRLATLLSQATPPQQRAANPQRRPHATTTNQPRPKSDGYALSQSQDSNDPYWKAGENAQPVPAKSTQNISYNSNENNSRTTGYSRNETDPVSHSKYPNEERREKYKPRPLNHSTQPRPAQSMSDLKSPTYPASKAKESDRNLTWQQKRAQNAYQHQRMKAQSQTTLPTSNDFSRNNKETDAQWRRKEVQNLITQKSPRSPKDMYYETSHSPHHHTNKFAVDNPNYELLPPPPSPPPESIQSPQSTPRDEPSHPPPPVDLPPAPKGHDMPDHSMKYNSSKTIDRPSSGRKEESRKPKAIQKSSAATKSSTLPRHFKSQSNWEKGSQDNYIQEQLNALRDDEIEELSAKFDSLTAFEKDRLDKLLNERDFQRRVQEDSRRYISDEEDDDEFIVPDRPDRDLLLQMKAKTDADTPQAENEERKRKQEEERYRKEKEEEERREKEERERIIRERLEQEREDRKREEDEKKNHDKYERVEAERRQKEKIFQEMQRREEEQWQKEQEELRRKEEEEERRRERERQEYEHEMRLRELQRKREEEENAIREIRAQREAQERVLRLEREQNRRRERSRHHAPSNDDDDERERELLEKKLSEGKPSNFTRFSSSSAPRYASQSTQGYAPMSATGYRKPSTNTYVHSAQRAYQPPMREGPKNSTRPVSDGYMLRNNDVFNHDNESPPRSANDVQTTPTNRPISYIASDKTPGVIGAQERYKDPRDKREATLKREQNSRRRQPDPSQMTFKDRQKLFTSGQTPTEKPRASKKLLEIQHSLM